MAYTYDQTREAYQFYGFKNITEFREHCNQNTFVMKNKIREYFDEHANTHKANEIRNSLQKSKKNIKVDMTFSLATTKQKISAYTAIMNVFDKHVINIQQEIATTKNNELQLNKVRLRSAENKKIEAADICKNWTDKKYVIVKENGIEYIVVDHTTKLDIFNCRTLKFMSRRSVGSFRFVNPHNGVVKHINEKTLRKKFNLTS